MKYKAIIFDDDVASFAIIKKIILKDCSRITVVSETTCPLQLIIDSNKNQPDLLLINIAVGNSTIFNFLRNIEKLPLIIFIASNGNYAAEAFNFNAVDFLLNPLGEKVLISALNRSKQLLDSRLQRTTTEGKIVVLEVSANSNYHLINITDILSITSDGANSSYIDHPIPV